MGHFKISNAQKFAIKKEFTAENWYNGFIQNKAKLP